MVTNPDYRALCEELSDELEEWVDGYLITDPPDEHTDAAYSMIERARAALAQPAPKLPTDKELIEQIAWMLDQDVYNNDTGGIGQCLRELISRWGQGNG